MAGGKFNDEVSWVAASKDCLCFDCKFRKEGAFGYMNGYCKKYPSGSGKPNEILFDNANCSYYEKE